MSEMDDLRAANRALILEIARVAAEAAAAKKAAADANRSEARTLQILLIARDEYESNYGRIIDGRNPHWTVMVRRKLAKRSRGKK